MKIGRIRIWKLLGLAAVVAATATLLSSAGTAAENQSVTLVWWHNVTQGAGLELYKDIASEFEKKNPNVTVEALPLQNEQFRTKIPIALQSDSPPDVFQSWGGGGLVEQQKAGKVANLTKYVKPWIKTLGGSAAAWQVNGTQYAIPYSVGSRRLLVQQGALPAGRRLGGTEDVAAVHCRHLEAEGRRHHADRGRQQGPVAGRLLLGLLGRQALQQEGHAAVGSHLQLP